MPHRSSTSPSGDVVACLVFHDRADALNAVFFLWERRLSGDYLFTPVVDAGISEDTNERLKILFRLHVEKLLECESVKKLEIKVEKLRVEISKCNVKKPGSLRVSSQNMDKKKGLSAEMEGIVRRIEEFRSGMNCVIDYLEGREIEELGVLRFGTEGGFNWGRLHSLLLRESRRLEDGLPLYGFRREILQAMHGHQVMVLIGETGSGKSTQLVQFLADSGVAAGGSILCTQPRKIAAISLAKRVGEECRGCYEDNSIACYPTFSSFQLFNSKVIYMTDHCLLQHLMKDKTLSEVSCIIIDEAHERSLNTDLLLALIKDLVIQRHDLKLLVMSATVNASKLSEYFFGCPTFHVSGRSFPVKIEYVPQIPRASDPLASFNPVASFVADVVKMTMKIHDTEDEGAILAFLTSQMEVEWACENFQSSSAIAFPLHGKLSHEEQARVFQNYPGKRKVIFSTNLAETSLTIAGVKFVVDSGMVKESRFEPTSGMSVLRVSQISQSSANQRAGRAGRTGPGKCFRLYSASDYLLMDLYQEPEICKVHLGIAVLRILALGIQNVQEFDFIDAPSAKAIDMAIRNLVQLGAVCRKSDVLELTNDGHCMVKLGIEPRLGKIILESCRQHLRKEGVVLASVMANASSIFCRVGTDNDKLRSDGLKVRFCHQDGDLFTLLSVYREWESVRPDCRNKWCWENSINAKTMRRCRDTVLELQNSLKNELNIIIPSYWLWDPYVVTCQDRVMRKIILSSLEDNIAMYSGYYRLGYQVVSSGEYVQLHPSCSLLMYNQKPNWVVFSELLSISSQYLVCVNAVDFDTLSALSPPLFDISKVESRKLQLRVIKGFGCIALKRFCGKSNNHLLSLLSRIQTNFMDERIGIEVDVNDNEIHLFAPSEDMENIYGVVNDALKYEIKWLSTECLEKCLYRGGRAGASPPIALFGSGAEIKHLELENRYLSVDVTLSNANAPDDKELLAFFENSVSGVCGFHKYAASGHDNDDKEKWGRLTFLTHEAARRALDLSGYDLSGSILQLAAAWPTVGGNKRLASFSAVKAKLIWPRRCGKGYAIARCQRGDAESVVSDCSHLLIGGRFIHCELSTKDVNSVVIRGLDREISEPEILETLQTATKRRILDLFLVRGDAVNSLPIAACEEVILKEIAPFMPEQGPLSDHCHIQVFPPVPKDSFMKAWITFDGKLHLEAAKALQHIQGKVLSGYFSWQKMQCQQVFHTSLSCPAPVYRFIERQLNILLKKIKHQPGIFFSTGCFLYMMLMFFSSLMCKLFLLSSRFCLLIKCLRFAMKYCKF
uniref:RNA helicase n=1 Tax=Rhizophora mucronata TaxID=61149 RepID=A0A2P2JTQ8_RHIMU